MPEAVCWHINPLSQLKAYIICLSDSLTENHSFHQGQANCCQLASVDQAEWYPALFKEEAGAASKEDSSTSAACRLALIKCSEVGQLAGAKKTLSAQGLSGKCRNDSQTRSRILHFLLEALAHRVPPGSLSSSVSNNGKRVPM